MKAVQTILAFDFGLKRIGIASGDTITRTAAPRSGAAVRGGEPDWAEIERQVRSLHPELLVVGDPYNVDGSPGAIAPAVRRFAAELERRFGLPVKMVDERWSSLEGSSFICDSTSDSVIGKGLLSTMPSAPLCVCSQISATVWEKFGSVSDGMATSR